MEFGHEARRVAGMRVDTWGAGPFQIEVAGKTFTFEDSERFGPFLLTKSGAVSEVQPGSRSPFWKAHTAWVRQGRRREGGKCIWSPGKPTLIRRKGPRMTDFEIVEVGDSLDDFIDITHDGKP